MTRGRPLRIECAPGGEHASRRPRRSSQATGVRRFRARSRAPALHEARGAPKVTAALPAGKTALTSSCPARARRRAGRSRAPLSATCGGEGGAKLADVLVDPAIDYRDHDRLADGRWIVGGQGRPGRARPRDARERALDGSPALPCRHVLGRRGHGPARRGLGSATVGANGARRSRRRSADRFRARRACGYEGSATSTTMLVVLATGDRATDPQRPGARSSRGAASCSWATAARTATRPRPAAPCTCRSSAASSWTVPLDPLEAMGVVGHRRDDRPRRFRHPLGAHGICETGGARRGGNLWRGGLGGWERVDIPHGPSDVMSETRRRPS